MKKILLLTLCLPLFTFAQSTGYELTGKFKTVEKEKGEEQQRLRGEIRVDEAVKVLQIDLRRMNPTVSGNIKVAWVVLIKDMQGKLRGVGKGEQKMAADVGIPIQIESETFQLKEVRMDGRGARDRKMEQEIEGYGVVIVDLKGEEVGARFQPKSIETQARALLKGEKR
ncbi:hypothetical protein P3T73_14200 [Kiritimatiellota bacterium B12222]|nr:hypothetical protein P3T73_14200 [Kiritimatiellota bacterium B12222]